MHLQTERKSLLLIKRNNVALQKRQLPYSRPMPQNRQELVESIEQDRKVLSAYFKKLSSQRDEVTSPNAAPPAADSLFLRETATIFSLRAPASVSKACHPNWRRKPEPHLPDNHRVRNPRHIRNGGPAGAQNAGPEQNG